MNTPCETCMHKAVCKHNERLYTLESLTLPEVFTISLNCSAFLTESPKPTQVRAEEESKPNTEQTLMPA